MKIFSILIIALVYTVSISARAMSTEQYKKLKQSIVSIKGNQSITLALSEPGEQEGTGFIVDKSNGLVVTASHVANLRTSHLLVKTLNGVEYDSKVVYTDPYFDFSILKVPLLKSKHEVTIKSSPIKLGEEVYLIGTNNGSEAILRSGKVVAINEDKGGRIPDAIISTIDRSSGSSGSPVFNIKGEVVALHYKGSSVTSIELPIYYIGLAIKHYKESSKNTVAEAGLDLAVINKNIAQNYLKSTSSTRNEILTVERAINGSPFFSKLLPGDIIHSVNGKKATSRIIYEELLINKKSVNFDIERFGKRLKVKQKVQRDLSANDQNYLSYMGSIFSNPTINTLMILHSLKDEGVLLTDSPKTSPLSIIGKHNKSHQQLVVIKSINGEKIKNIKALSKALAEAIKQRYLFVVFDDIYLGVKGQIKFIRLPKSSTTNFSTNDN